jgi:inhibitor of KinA
LFTRYLLDHTSPEILNIHPAYNSVMVTISNEGSISRVTEHLQKSISNALIGKTPRGRAVEIPVLYNGKMGPDMGLVCKKTGLDPAEVIKRHSEANYLVYFTGFSIGFPYLGGMDESIAAPRLDLPRKSVPAGSVGIAGNQTGIYPMSSPGGWNLIGRTPLSIFNAKAPGDSLVQMGDIVRFRPIDETEYDALVGK